MFLLVVSFSVFVENNAFTMCTGFGCYGYGVITYVLDLVYLGVGIGVVSWFID